MSGYESSLKQGQHLESVFSLPRGEFGETVGASISFPNVEKIVVCQLRGPMGFYDAAKVYHIDDAAPVIIPLMHMATINPLGEFEPKNDTF